MNYQKNKLTSNLQKHNPHIDLLIAKCKNRKEIVTVKQTLIFLKKINLFRLAVKFSLQKVLKVKRILVYILVSVSKPDLLPFALKN